MKRYLIIIIFILSCGSSWGASKSDSIYTTSDLDLFVNRCVDNLDSINYLDTHAIAKDIQICNLATCFTILEVSQHDSLLRFSTYKRIQEIAKVFFLENTPIIIVGLSMNSMQLASDKNKQNQIPGLRYISLGNGCLPSTDYEKGISEFNKMTYYLLGL